MKIIGKNIWPFISGGLFFVAANIIFCFSFLRLLIMAAIIFPGRSIFADGKNKALKIKTNKMRPNNSSAFFSCFFSCFGPPLMKNPPDQAIKIRHQTVNAWSG